MLLFIEHQSNADLPKETCVLHLQSEYHLNEIFFYNTHVNFFLKVVWLLQNAANSFFCQMAKKFNK